MAVFRAIYTDGVKVHRYSFPSREESDDFFEQIETIKASIARINLVRVADPNHENRNHLADYAPWLDQIHAFRGRWPTRMLPVDIQVATNGVESLVGRAVTLF